MIVAHYSVAFAISPNDPIKSSIGKRTFHILTTPIRWICYLIIELGLLLKRAFCFSCFMKKKILIYRDQGVLPQCFTHTFTTLNNHLGTRYEIKAISSKEILENAWEKTTALLVFPGGADIPYMKLLQGKGNQKIQNYVQNGGSFLGICAGAYYSGGKVEFALGTPMQVKEDRELKFFPGTVRGPLLSGNLAKIFSNFLPNESLKTYYEGGGYFYQPEKYKNVSVLAFYDAKKKFPAIVECGVGKGKAILTGVHLEYCPELLTKNEFFLKTIIPKLQKHNAKRNQLLKHLFARLNLK